MDCDSASLLGLSPQGTDRDLNLIYQKNTGIELERGGQHGLECLSPTTSMADKLEAKLLLNKQCCKKAAKAKEAAEAAVAEAAVEDVALQVEAAKLAEARKAAEVRKVEEDALAAALEKVRAGKKKREQVPKSTEESTEDRKEKKKKGTQLRSLVLMEPAR